MIKPSDSLFPANDLWNLPLAWQEYWLDTAQRWVLSLDLLRQRGNAYVERTQEIAPHVLNFAASLLIDGRKLERPVNYVLVEIVPPKGITIDPHRRPFIIFDPRAGHGPGIGGMKHDSEIGVALREGHPCYFVGFLPEPVPGQTVEDVCAAEALFVKTVIDRHPEAEGRPVLIGNCQAGWQIMMMAAVRPDLTGPIMLAGSPLSYWAGVRGKNPMRYFGGLLGGTWLTALAGDLGNGVVDGANLIAMPACADMVRANRRPASADNPLVAAEKALSDTIETTLQTWADQRDQLLEATFLAIYGMPLVQALAGLSPEREASEASPERDLALEAASKRVAQDAVARLRMGGPIAAALRALVYVLGGEKSVDERAFAVLVQIAANSPALQELGFGGFRDLLRDQQMIMRLEPERGVEVIPDMLADADMEARAGALRAITRVVSAGETLSKDGQARLEKISAMFTPTAGGTSRANRGRHLPRGRRTGQAGVRRKAVKNRD
jgi:pimeloyl-ACP methyl ester carboxylesterase